jgi:hypothetical protein
MDKADVKRLKESGVFGPLTFWVTEIQNLEDVGNPNSAVRLQGVCSRTEQCLGVCWRRPTAADSAPPLPLLSLPPLAAVLQTGVLIRGNLRADRAQVFAAVCDKVKELFGEKYEVLMIEDPEAYADGAPPEQRPSSSSSGGAGGSGAAAVLEPRVAFQVRVFGRLAVGTKQQRNCTQEETQRVVDVWLTCSACASTQVVPAAEVTPPQSNGWKLTVAGILLVLLTASSVQLSLVANITKLPKVGPRGCGLLRFNPAATEGLA